MNRDRDNPTVVFRDPPDQGGDLLLLALRKAMWMNPIAAQALYRAFVAEGRRYMETDEGAALAETLRNSPMLDQIRVVWDTVTSRALDDDVETVIPSVVVDAIVKAASDRSLRSLIQVLNTAGAAEFEEEDD